MLLTRTHGLDLELWYRLALMVETWTHGIASVLLNHTRTRGPSVPRMRDFLVEFEYQNERIP